MVGRNSWDEFNTVQSSQGEGIEPKEVSITTILGSSGMSIHFEISDEEKVAVKNGGEHVLKALKGLSLSARKVWGHGSLGFGSSQESVDAL